MRTRITMSAALAGALAVVPNLAGAGAEIGGPTGIVIAQRDGTPGNPPSTATGRTVDRAQGQTPRPDGTPGNPPGTAAGRAVDRTLGTGGGTGSSR
jgi:hypothetical protein